MSWFQRCKKHKRRKRMISSDQDNSMDISDHGKTSGWAELDRHDVISFWTKSHGVK